MKDVNNNKIKLSDDPMTFEIDYSKPHWGRGSHYGWGYDEEVERELWKPVTDYRGWPIREGYWVSNKGRVYSQIGDKKQLLKMNHYKSSKRYYVRMTGKDGKRRNVNPAWLVISAWVRNPLPKLLVQVNHRDGDFTNNALANLEYITDSLNKQHYWHEIRPYIEKAKPEVMPIE